jgi:hypothetical protein
MWCALTPVEMVLDKNSNEIAKFFATWLNKHLQYANSDAAKPLKVLRSPRIEFEWWRVVPDNSLCDPLCRHTMRISKFAATVPFPLS